MQYIKFGKDGIDVSKFGMGCMRFPQIKDGSKSEIDEKQSIKMIHYAIDNGVNYFDTAYAYGNSELVVGKALSNGRREKVILATKLPTWLINTYSDFGKYLDEQLKRLNVEYIDVFLLHALKKKWWLNLKNLDVFSFIEDSKKKGKIRFAGFSFHDELSLFKEIINSYDWDTCLMQLNYMDEKMQAGIDGLKYANSKGASVCIMEPLKGGSLVNDLPKEAINLLNNYSGGIKPLYLAFRHLCSMPEAKVILSGVSSLKQLIEDIEIFGSMSLEPLNSEELALINKVRDLIKSKIKTGCTGCGYCLPCPSDVAIPDIFRLYEDAHTLNKLEVSRSLYKNIYIYGEKDASMCTECGQCEENCPQKLEIIQILKDVHKLLG